MGKNSKHILTYFNSNDQTLLVLLSFYSLLVPECPQVPPHPTLKQTFYRILPSKWTKYQHCKSVCQYYKSEKLRTLMPWSPFSPCTFYTDLEAEIMIIQNTCTCFMCNTLDPGSPGAPGSPLMANSKEFGSPCQKVDQFKIT